jgi:hypothetical protein
MTVIYLVNHSTSKLFNEVCNLKIFAGKQLEKDIHNPLPETLGRLSGPDIFTRLPDELALIIEFDLPAVFRFHQFFRQLSQFLGKFRAIDEYAHFGVKISGAWI